jgi:dihydrolipoamide dehydrogenase
VHQHIFAIGDIVGQPILAHKAVLEADLAAKVIAGELQGKKELVSDAYSVSKLARVGLTETEGKAQGLKVKKGLFP